MPSGLGHIDLNMIMFYGFQKNSFIFKIMFIGIQLNSYTISRTLYELDNAYPLNQSLEIGLHVGIENLHRS